MIASFGLLAIAGVVHAQSAISYGIAYGTAYASALTSSATPKWQNFTSAISQSSPADADLTCTTVTETKTVTETVSLKPMQSSACFTTTVTEFVAISVTEKQVMAEPTGPVYYKVDDNNSTTFLNGDIPSGASIVYASEPTVVVITPVPAASIATASPSTTTLTSIVFETLTRTVQRPSNVSTISEEDVIVTATKSSPITRTVTIPIGDTATVVSRSSSEVTTTVTTTSTTIGTVSVTITRNWNSTTSSATAQSKSEIPSEFVRPLASRYQSGNKTFISAVAKSSTYYAVPKSSPASNISQELIAVLEPNSSEGTFESTLSAALISISSHYTAAQNMKTFAETIPTAATKSVSSKDVLASPSVTASVSNASVVVLTQSYTEVITAYTAIPLTSFVGESIGRVNTVLRNNTTWIITLPDDSTATATNSVSAKVTKSSSVAATSMSPISASASDPARSNTVYPSWQSRWDHDPVVIQTPSITRYSSKVTHSAAIDTMAGPVLPSQALPFKSPLPNEMEGPKESSSIKSTERSTMVADDATPGFILHGHPATMAKVVKK